MKRLKAYFIFRNILAGYYFPGPQICRIFGHKKIPGIGGVWCKRCGQKVGGIKERNKMLGFIAVISFCANFAHAGTCENNVRATIRTFDADAAETLEIKCIDNNSERWGRATVGRIEIGNDAQDNRRILMHEVLHATHNEQHRRGDCVMDETPENLECPHGFDLDTWYGIVKDGNAGKYTIPKTKEWTQLRDSCVEGITPADSYFPFVQAHYCGCFADQVMNNIPDRNWLKDPQYKSRMNNIIDKAFDYCNDSFEQGQRDAIPYSPPKPKNRGGR